MVTESPNRSRDVKYHAHRLERPDPSVYTFALDKPEFTVAFALNQVGKGVYSVFFDFVVDAPIVEIMTVATDLPRWKDWLPCVNSFTDITEVHPSTKEDENHHIGQIGFKIPLHIIPKKYRGREMTISTDYFHHEGDNEILYMTVADPADPTAVPYPKKFTEANRVRFLDGLSKLTPMPPKKSGGPGRTRITLYTDVDPKLPSNIPGLFVKWLFKMMVPLGIRTFKKQAKVARKTGPTPAATRVCNTFNGVYPPDVIYGVASMGHEETDESTEDSEGEDPELMELKTIEE